MANIIKYAKMLMRKGLKADLTTLDEAELGLATDTKEVFVGANDGNIQLATQTSVDNLQTSVSNTQNNLGVLAELPTIDKGSIIGAFKEETSRRKNLGVNIKDFNASGSTQTTTGSIAGGSNILNLSSAIDFADNQGVSIHHAGAVPTITAPSAPSITVSGVSGTTPYAYQIAAVNKNGGLSVASSAGQITTGNSNLSDTLSDPSALSLAKSGSGSALTSGNTYYVGYTLRNNVGTTTKNSSQVSTTVTSGQNIITSFDFPTGAVSADVYVGTTSAPKRLATVDKVGVITFDGGLASGLTVTVSGSRITLTISATASATGADAPTSNTTKSLNNITWSAVTGAVRYAVYRSVNNGAYSLVAIKTGGTSWTDTGITDVSGYYSPLWNTPPVSPLAETLNTTIVSGGGTKTLTLATNAITSSISQTVRHDDTDALQAFFASGSRFIMTFGTYSTRKRITLNNNQILEGIGGENNQTIIAHECFDVDAYDSVIRLTGDNPAVISVNVSCKMNNIVDCIRLDTTTGDAAKPFQALCQRVKTTGGYKGFNVNSGIEARLEYCLATYASYAGVNVLVPDTHLIDCSSESCYYGLKTGTGCGTITAHHFHAILSTTYGFYLDNATYGQFVNCQADTSGQSGVFMVNTTNCQFTNFWSFKSSSINNNQYHDWHINASCSNNSFTNCVSLAFYYTLNSFYFSAGTKNNSFINCSGNGSLQHGDGVDALRNANQFSGCMGSLAKYNRKTKTSSHVLSLAAGASSTVSHYLGYTPSFSNDVYLFKLTYNNRAQTAPSPMAAGHLYFTVANGTTNGGTSAKTTYFSSPDPENFTVSAVLNGDKIDITVTNSAGQTIDYGFDIERHMNPKGL
jgi:hypothetical protein